LAELMLTVESSSCKILKHLPERAMGFYSETRINAKSSGSEEMKPLQST
jgi:hypothetical protein